GGGGGGATPTPTATPGGGGGPGPTPTATPPASGPPTLTVEQQGKPKVRHHKFSVKLACSASATCTGTLAILRGTKTLASKTVSVDPRTAKLVKIKLNASGYALFKQKGSTLNVTAKVTAGGLVDKRDIRIVKPGLT
ncbi:MAG: hypothetical protein QOF76_3497, partial [Solirubrobacteraceae bacterium]|nr:hypothetical protein [Solirubrobacteraceae bacterium]